MALDSFSSLALDNAIWVSLPSPYPDSIRHGLSCLMGCMASMGPGSGSWCHRSVCSSASAGPCWGPSPASSL
jgi:hypothetical protein